MLTLSVVCQYCSAACLPQQPPSRLSLSCPRNYHPSCAFQAGGSSSCRCLTRSCPSAASSDFTQNMVAVAPGPCQVTSSSLAPELLVSAGPPQKRPGVVDSKKLTEARRELARGPAGLPAGGQSSHFTVSATSVHPLLLQA